MHDVSPFGTDRNATVIKSCKEPFPDGLTHLWCVMHSHAKVPVFLSVLYLILKSVSHLQKVSNTVPGQAHSSA